MIKTSTDKKKIKFLLLEGIHPSALDVLKAAGYTQIESLAGALADDDLKAKTYLSLRREHVSTFDQLLKARGYAVWANPRGWERLGRALDDAAAHGEKMSHEEIIGDIGEPVGREFIAFMHAAMTLVDYEQIISEPEAAPLPEKLSDVYAVVAMLSATTQARDMSNIRRYVERFAPEVQVLYLRLLVSSKGAHVKACVTNKAYTEWFSSPTLRAALL